MAGKTQTQADAVLNLARGSNATAFTPYVGLLSTAPSDDSLSGTELSGSGYDRVAVTFSAPADASGAKLARRCYVSADVVFPTASGDWLQAVAFGVYDASSGGALRYWGTLAAPQTATAGGRIELTAASTYIEEG